ncbi:nicotinate-nucleotide--dimethylbenzimidazole phosphoribosyltransferase [uncultured Phascolarctobacterium sp.]|uniref:nicotinate-nucleotide--dimethylbenzimidazole phosphoribosyltransferase n=1 Tax=uncultured Phascolarctobacterium sp. TaxID=512296 RepID=UPI0025CC577E|nr:nicotinate-nucleotide--dimethylbenzimidazole phosphoribosyltransferase [uncultured Phascolarctobacterium sp.]
MENIVIPALDEDRAQEVRRGWQTVNKFGKDLGKLEEMVEQYAAMTAKELPEKLRSAMVLMCGDHGIAKYGVSAYPQEVTRQMINGYMRETAGASVLARHAKADVYVCDAGTAFDLSDLDRVYHKKVAWGTNDFTQGPAMTRQQAEAALQVGIEMAELCIDKGYNLLYTGEMGIGNTTSTAAIASAFMGLDPLLTVGRGSGINDDRMKIKRQVVIDGLAKNKPVQGDAMDVLCKVGGYDHAGLAGVIIGAARRRVPTMVDGVNATAAALLAYGLYPESRNYMLCSHLSSDISHKKMLEIMHLTPIVDAGMRLGEGTGASLAIVVLQAAIDVYNTLSR